MKQSVRTPVEFAEVFTDGGYRAVEHVFGSRIAVNMRNIALCGGDELIAARRKARKRK